MTSVTSRSTTILDLPPSCIETCPWNRNLFAIGTYYLEKREDDEALEDSQTQTQKRSGSVLIVRLSDDHNSVELVQTYPTDYAILDLHFPLHEGDNSRCIWTANSTGSLTRYTVTEEPSFTIRDASVLQLWEPDILVLSFAFHPSMPQVLGATLSNGSVVVCKINDELNAKMSTLIDISKHDLEAWTLSFDLTGERCLSGGDDSTLQNNMVQNISELDNSAADEEVISPVLVWKNRRLHHAGVTAILPLEADVVLTGSYDDTLRIITLDKPPRLLAEENLGGGVWRLKLIQADRSSGHRSYDILASCMHTGARIVRITFTKNTGTAEDPRIEVLASFKEHESMNYGSDFVQEGYNYTILSTSFYDKRLCLWEFRAPDFDTNHGGSDEDGIPSAREDGVQKNENQILTTPS